MDHKAITLDDRARLGALLAEASIEVTAKSDDQLPVIKELYRRGSDVHVTALPNDPLSHTIAMARHLVDAGFNPVPHLTARGFASRRALEDFVIRSSDVGVRRMLVIAGDVAKPNGPYPDSLSVLKTGLLDKHGIRSIGVAGHPEGHPNVAREVLEQALRDKVAAARRAGLAVQVITQFAFEAEPFVAYLDRLEALGIEAPVRLGIAGPANLMTLIRYGMRCGVGNSIKALRKQSDVLGRLAGDTPPDELLAEIVRRAGDRVAGFHFYVFGGLKKTGVWLNAALKNLAAEDRIAG